MGGGINKYYNFNTLSLSENYFIMKSKCGFHLIIDWYTELEYE